VSSDHQHAGKHLRRLFSQGDAAQLTARLAAKPPESTTPLPPRVPGGSLTDPAAVARRWEALGRAPDPALWDADSPQTSIYAKHIENLVGAVSVPVGLAGPLRVNGLYAQGDFYVPMATTEAALVASYHRGALLTSEAGGCTVGLLAEGVSRAPGFVFETLAEVGQFIAWAVEQTDAFRQAAAATTRHGELIDMRFTVEGNRVYLQLEFLTGDAAGQNMVTLAAHAICEHIAAHSPVRPRHAFVESNLSGDKKASAQSFQSVRGRKASAEVRLPGALVERRLHTTAETMCRYWSMSALGGVLSGTIGVQGHYANGLAALYLATGQDVACVSESSVGVTRFEIAGRRGLVRQCDAAQPHRRHGRRRDEPARPTGVPEPDGLGGRRQGACVGRSGRRVDARG
jgi:hydroxymethylglutaryl-CoA reductase (NADPH)